MGHEQPLDGALPSVRQGLVQGQVAASVGVVLVDRAKGRLAHEQLRAGSPPDQLRVRAGVARIDDPRPVVGAELGAPGRDVMGARDEPEGERSERDRGLGIVFADLERVVEEAGSLAHSGGEGIESRADPPGGSRTGSRRLGRPAHGNR